MIAERGDTNFQSSPAFLKYAQASISLWTFLIVVCNEWTIFIVTQICCDWVFYDIFVWCVVDHKKSQYSSFIVSIGMKNDFCGNWILVERTFIPSDLFRIRMPTLLASIDVVESRKTMQGRNNELLQRVLHEMCDSKKVRWTILLENSNHLNKNKNKKMMAMREIIDK